MGAELIVRIKGNTTYIKDPVIPPNSRKTVWRKTLHLTIPTGLTMGLKKTLSQECL